MNLLQIKLFLNRGEFDVICNTCAVGIPPFIRLDFSSSEVISFNDLDDDSSIFDNDVDFNKISLNAQIYIDQDLGEGELTGEVWAKNLFAKGFLNIFLATGYNPEHFRPSAWIKNVTGKEPPWS
jgi:hypothetical protein